MVKADISRQQQYADNFIEIDGRMNVYRNFDLKMNQIPGLTMHLALIQAIAAQLEKVRQLLSSKLSRQTMNARLVIIVPKIVQNLRKFRSILIPKIYGAVDEKVLRELEPAFQLLNFVESNVISLVPSLDDKIEVVAQIIDIINAFLFLLEGKE